MNDDYPAIKSKGILLHRYSNTTSASDTIDSTFTSLGSYTIPEQYNTIFIIARTYGRFSAPGYLTIDLYNGSTALASFPASENLTTNSNFSWNTSTWWLLSSKGITIEARVRVISISSNQATWKNANYADQNCLVVDIFGI